MNIIEESKDTLRIHLSPEEAGEIARNLLDNAKLLGDKAAVLGQLLKDAGYDLAPEDGIAHFEHHNPDESNFQHQTPNKG